MEASSGRLCCIDYGCIETSAGEPKGERLLFIFHSIIDVLKKYTPGFAAMENLYFGKNISSGMAVAEARGVLLMALSSFRLPVLELTPGAIKKSVAGVTRADKNQVQQMVRVILGLKDIPKPDHAADALGAAICAAHSPDINLNNISYNTANINMEGIVAKKDNGVANFVAKKKRAGVRRV